MVSIQLNFCVEPVWPRCGPDPWADGKGRCWLQKLQAVTPLMINLAVERFGFEEKKESKRSYTKNHTEVTLSRSSILVIPVQTSKRARTTCPSPVDNYLEAEVQGPALGWVAQEVLLRATRRAAFISNPFHFSKELLEKKHRGKQSCSEEETYLRRMYSDPRRNKGLVQSIVRPTQVKQAVWLIWTEAEKGDGCGMQSKI